MVLVELNNLSYRYGTSIYAIDRVNVTMYGKFSVGCKLIPEKATIIPQYQSTGMESRCTPAYENKLPGITGVPTPITESTPVTHPYPIPITRAGIASDMVQPISSEEARARYLEKQMKGMESVKLPTNISSLEEELFVSTDLTERIAALCKQQKEKRRKERESHKVFLGALIQKKSKPTVQPMKEDGDVVYSQLSHSMEKTRDVVQRSLSQASTISAEEQQMMLTEKEFSMIKEKMDKIDRRLHELYKNWHAEYGNANTIEECEEIRDFYKPYLDKYKSKYRILYQLLQKPRPVLTHSSVSELTPSLTALDDATTLKQKKGIRSEPGEDLPRQYYSIEGRLTPHTPRSEDINLEQTLNITPEGSLRDIPTVIQRETLGESRETAYMEFPAIRVETTPKEPTVPKSLP